MDENREKKFKMLNILKILPQLIISSKNIPRCFRFHSIKNSTALNSCRTLPRIQNRIGEFVFALAKSFSFPNLIPKVETRNGVLDLFPQKTRESKWVELKQIKPRTKRSSVQMTKLNQLEHFSRQSKTQFSSSETRASRLMSLKKDQIS